MGDKIIKYNNSLLNWNSMPIRVMPPNKKVIPIPEDGLVSIYRFDGDLVDSVSGLNLSGGTASYPSGSIPSNYAQCAEFGLSNTAYCAYRDLATTYSGIFSVSYWFYCLAEGNGVMITNTGNVYQRNGFVISFEGNNSYRLLYGLSHSGIGGRLISSTNTYAEDVWNHVVFTYNSGTFKLYLNNVAQNSDYYATGITGNMLTVLGCVNTFNGGFLNYTYMASLFIYNKVLSETEITTLYNDGKGL